MDMGDIPHLATKNHLSLWGGIRRIGNWMDQKMRWLIIPWVVMPTLSGMWFGMLRYEGQMERMICVMAVEPV